MILFLMTLLTGCSQKPTLIRTVEVPVMVHTPLPPEATAPVDVPQLGGFPVTNRDLVDYVFKLKSALREANRKLEAIKDQWYD